MDNFIYDIIDKDLADGAYDKIQTRFPPEPSGHLHIGHAKAIYMDFMAAIKYNGICNLRFDDTNPKKRYEEYMKSIEDDIHWLGFEYDNVYSASEYFDFLYDCAIKLINKGLAYVCDLSADEIREYRGTLTQPGKNSPYRDRTIEDNLALFEKMRLGEFADGEKVLRAKIDMADPNINMRDPVIYRINHLEHPVTKDKWCIYPMYDFTHPLSDAYEGVTHSFCTLEFENNRPLYNWFLEKCEIEKKPKQIEFARLNLNYCITSKRKNLYLVENNFVNGWDDPRMATLCAMRRRGYTPASIRNFCEQIGLSKSNSIVDYGVLEGCVRDDLNQNAKRAMAVLDPIKLVIDNYPEGKTEEFEINNNPNDENAGTHKVSFSRELYIEREDFAISPPKKYFRLFIGNEVRLVGAYYVTATSYETDENGKITTVHCTYDPESRGATTKDKRKVKGTIHFVDANNCFDAEIRIYDRLFKVENPAAPNVTLEEALNENSLTILQNCKLESELKKAKIYENFQFMRKGYFCIDYDSTEEHPIFNMTVALRSSWK
ncbi:MAG: glutamine--tRNA ligase/YqeY domain fusion protein [Clostridia bacterium]|nr:glutamine--tRNA ligase/YqeY domain fusion protein [Clostridia bacterium]